MKRPSLLIVDDEQDFKEMLKTLLNAKFSIDCDEAKNGIEALELIKKNAYTCVLLDIKMPQKGGISVIEEAKKIRPDLNIIVISAWLSNQVIDQSIRSRADDYITKPIDENVLEMKLKKVFERAK